MGIFQRISDIISANFNDLVDQYEDPEKMLRQVIREMETAISDSKRDVAKAMANEKMLKKELAANEMQVESWTARAEKAVDGGDDALARKALARKREYEKIVEALGDQLVAAGDSSRLLRRQLEAMQAKLSEARRRQATLAARKKAADVKAKIAAFEDSDVELNQDAFDKFDRLSRKVEMAEAEAEALAELSKKEFDDVSFEDSDEPGLSSDDLEIESELSMLKKKKKKGS